MWVTHLTVRLSTLVKKIWRFILSSVFILLGLNTVDCCIVGNTPILAMARVGVPQMPALSPPVVSSQPQPIDGYIPNPGMGWQNSWLGEPRFPESIIYLRFNWDTVHIASDRYDWTELDRAMAEARLDNIKVSFRVRPARPPKWGTGEAMPAWIEQLGAPIAESSSGSEPLYHSCIYLEEHGRFVEEMRRRFDGDNVVAFIDIGSYGQYGEWWSDQYDETKGSLDWHARRWIADMYLGGSARRPCLDPFGTEIEVAYDFIGFQKTQLIMPYTPWFEDSLLYALEKRADVGIRHDALGSERHQKQFRSEISTVVDQRWQDAPIVFEFANNADNSQELESAQSFAQEMHASIIHDNLEGRGNDEALIKILENVGYRLTLSSFQFRSPIQAGSLFSLVISLENKGIAPPYLDAQLGVRLRNEADETIFWSGMEVDSRKWLPDEEIVLRMDRMLPASMPAGGYTVELAFIDPVDELPLIRLANGGQNDEGWLDAGVVIIQPK